MDGSPHCSAETLSALLDGELAAAERAGARAHLASCPACGARLVAAERLDAALRDPAQLSCASVRPTFSALADGEAAAGERALAEAHLLACADCQAYAADVRSADRLLATLPVALPSARVDAAIAALRPAPRRALRPAAVGLRAAGALALALLIAAGSGILPALRPQDSRAQPAETALVAAAQRVIFDARTNTLYVLDPVAAEVRAVDATTQAERARVVVGGTPTAIALSAVTNRVLVLDAATKRLTEIDATTNSVVAAATLAVTGTPTSLQVDPSGKIVVASVPAVAGMATTSTPSTAAGHVTVFDAVSKQVETVRAVDVAPQLVVLDAKGAQALLLSARVTSLVDAATYRSIDQLPGGVAAAFDAAGGGLAILSSDPDTGSRLSFRGPGLPASLALAGRPLALIALPGGGFAALLDRGGGGEIDVIDAGGRLSASLSVALAGRSLTYDPLTARFAVGGDAGARLAFSGDVAVAGSGASSVPSVASPTPSVAPRTPPPSAEPAASAAPSPASTALPPAARPEPNASYRLTLGDNRRPVLVSSGGDQLWFVDEAKRLATIDVRTGRVTDRAQLPLDGVYARLLIGTDRIYAVDQRSGRVAVYAPSSGAFSAVAFPFAAIAKGFAVGPDDRLWLGGGESSNVLALDPFNKRVTAIDVRTSGLSALYVDTAARVWFADDATGGLGYYDQVRQQLVALALPPHASVTALTMDRDGTLWLGTAAGELLSARLGVVRSAGSAGGPVTDLVRDPAGGAWSYAAMAGAVALRPLTQGAAPQVIAGGGTSLALDSLGRAWVADPAGMGFYIVGTGTR